MSKRRYNPKDDQIRPELDPDVVQLVYAFMAKYPSESMRHVVNKHLRIALAGKFTEEVKHEDPEIQLENGRVLRPQQPMRREWNL